MHVNGDILDIHEGYIKAFPQISPDVPYDETSIDIDLHDSGEVP